MSRAVPPYEKNATNAHNLLPIDLYQRSHSEEAHETVKEAILGNPWLNVAVAPSFAHREHYSAVDSGTFR